MRACALLGTGALLSFAAVACSKPAAKSGAGSDSIAATPAALSDVENPSCDSVRNYSPTDAFITVSLDSAAATANRLLISIIKSDGQPFRAKLLATTGSTECQTGARYIAFRVREPQSFLSVVIYTSTDYVGVEVKRLEKNAGELSSRAFGADGSQQELVWNGAPRAFERTPLIDDGSGPQRNPNIGKPLIHRPQRP